MVQTVVDSIVHASQLLSQVPVCTWEIHNTIQVPERAVSVVFRRNRAIELQTSLSEGDRMRVEGLRPLGTSVSGTCLGLGCRVGRALFPAGQDSWHPLVSQGNAIYERDVYSCTCVHVMCVSRICPPRSLCPKGYPSSPLLQGSQCEHGHCFPGVFSLVRAETQFGITDLEY